MSKKFEHLEVSGHQSPIGPMLIDTIDGDKKDQGKAWSVFLAATSAQGYRLVSCSVFPDLRSGMPQGWLRFYAVFEQELNSSNRHSS
ncbi:MAG: hypothetical protein HYV90_00060 [Candidatus Woesebacteria bacterium]|nr:MAG: hypothetical protein HYV90_00060 [Candidatus Woesebacteria bacterium]